MRNDTRDFKDATTRRTQPNWIVECVKAGIPFHRLPTPPAADATKKEKIQYAWTLRRLWSEKTGKKIERLTPPGYNDKIDEKRRKQRQAALGLTERPCVAGVA